MWIMDQPLNKEFIPDYIPYLGVNDIFVFGIDKYGRHDGGAAKIDKIYLYLIE